MEEVYKEPPKNFKGTSGDQEVRLTWENPKANQFSKVVVRRSVSDFPGHAADGDSVYDGREEAFTDTGLVNDTRYYYAIFAEYGDGGYSDRATLSAMPKNDLLPPVMPTGLRIGETDTDSISLSWNAVPQADRYELRRDGSDVYSGSDTSFTDTGLSGNTEYIYHVRAINAAGTSDWSGAVKGQTDLALPSGLRVVDTTTDTMILLWNDVPDADSYELQRNGNEVYNGSRTSYTDTGLAGNTEFSYRVRAKNTAGTSSWSAEVKGRTDLAPPAVPAGLRIAGTTTDTMSLLWNDVPGADRYELQRDGNEVYSGYSASYTDTGLGGNTEFSYRIRAKNAAGTSDWSAEVKGQTDLAPPAVPVGLRITGTTIDTINLIWDDVPGADGYELHRDGSEVYSGSSASYTDTGLSDDTVYSYKVRAKNAAGTSSWSAAVSGRTEAIIPVNGVSIDDKDTTILPMGGTLQLTATITPPDATDKGVIWESGNSSVAAVSDTGIVTPLKAGGSVTITVKARADYAITDSIDIVTVMADAPPGKPVITASVAGDGKIDLTWSPPGDGGFINGNGTPGTVTKYTVYWGSSTITTSSTDKADVTAPAYTITGLTNGSDVFFIVTAWNASGEGLPSTQGQARPFAADAVPSPPLKPRASANDGRVQLNWNEPTNSGYINGDGSRGIITGYRVYYSTTQNFDTGDPGVKSADTPDGATRALLVDSLINNTNYYFLITAFNATGESQPTAEISQRPRIPNAVPGAPTNITATADNAGAVLRWGVPADLGIINNDGSTGVITRYTIYYSTTSGFSIRDSGVTSQVVTDTAAFSASVEGLSNGTAYYFVLTAHNASGEGPASTQASVTPSMPRLVGLLENWQDSNTVVPIKTGSAIRTVSELKAMVADGEYYLAAHINLSSSNWTPLFPNGSPFRGKLHGNGFIVYNLNINNTSASYQGLFGALEGATITNLGIGVNELKIHSVAGALAGYADAATTLDNITASGFSGATRRIYFYGNNSISGTSGTFVGGIVGYFLGNLTKGYSDLTLYTASSSHHGKLGGLVGYNGAGKVDGSYSGTMDVDSGHGYSGGLVGYNNGGRVTGSTSGEIDIDHGYYTGGLVGYNNGGTVHGTASIEIDDHDSSDYIGGLVGYSINGTITGSCTIGSRNIDGDYYVGGLLGYSENDSITGFMVGDIRGFEYIGGLVGRSKNSTIIGSSKADIFGLDNADKIGGLVGESRDSTVIGTSGSDIERGDDYVGGLVGYVSGGSVIGATYGEVHSDGTSSSDIGGLVGANSGGDISGYFLGWVWADNPSSDIGPTIGDPSNDNNADQHTYYYSGSGEDRVGNNFDGNGFGTPIDGGSQNGTRGKMRNLTEGSNVGEWVFVDGHWPHLNLPDSVTDYMNYTADDDSPPPGFEN